MDADKHGCRVDANFANCREWKEPDLNSCNSRRPRKRNFDLTTVLGRISLPTMSATEIINELPKLTEAELRLVRQRLLELAAQNQIAPAWDDRERAPWFWFYRNGLREYVFYNDARSFRERYALARSRGLHSFSSWVLGAEDPEVWKELPRAQR